MQHSAQLLDRTSVAGSLTVEEFSQVFRLRSCFCKIMVRDLNKSAASTGPNNA
jgi:hypothetical protein